MENRRLFMKNKFVPIIITLFTVFSNPVYAQGIPVIDGQGLVQHVVNAMESVAQTAKQIEQYKTQLQQYQNMLQNTMTPDYYLWADAQSAMNGLYDAMNSFNQFRDSIGDYQKYLDLYKILDQYSTHNCFMAKGCTKEEQAQLDKELAMIDEANKRANDDSFKVIDQQQRRLKTEAAELQRLQMNAQGAQGQLEALQYANQFAAAQVYQLQQMRGAMLAQQQAVTTQLANTQNEKALQQAQQRKLTEGDVTNSSEGSSLPVGKKINSF